MIEAQKLNKRFGETDAITDVSFRIDRGEILGFLGPNAAGKTTTMRILTGFLPPTSGTALVAGFDVLDEPLEVKKRIGYLPETPPLYADLTVASFLRFVARIRGIPGSEQKESMDWAIERCGLQEVRKRLIHNLSKGFKQRVGLAQAMIHRPDVLILDEPTVGLDPRQIREIRGLISELSKDHTIILSTHILPEVTMICSRAIIIHRGRIVLDGAITELTKDRTLEEVFIDLITREEEVRPRDVEEPPAVSA